MNSNNIKDQQIKSLLLKSVKTTNVNHNIIKENIMKKILVTNPSPSRIQYWLYNLLSLFKMDKQTLIRTLLSLLTVVGGTGATAVVADKAVPGDTLYQVDLAFEKVGEFFQFSDSTKLEYENKLIAEREEEIKQLMRQNRVETTEESKKQLQEAISQLEKQIEKLEEVRSNIKQSGDKSSEDVLKKTEENKKRADGFLEEVKSRIQLDNEIMNRDHNNQKEDLNKEDNQEEQIQERKQEQDREQEEGNDDTTTSQNHAESEMHNSEEMQPANESPSNFHNESEEKMQEMKRM